MQQTCFEKKVEQFFDTRGLVPFPCDPNRESPPSLITSKAEFMPFESHCDTYTGTRIGLKVGKFFSA